MIDRAERAKLHAASSMPLTANEISYAINSLRNVTPVATRTTTSATDDDDDGEDDDGDECDEHENDGGVDWEGLSNLISEIGHLFHGNWEMTERNSIRLADILFENRTSSSGMDMKSTTSALASSRFSDVKFRHLFERVMHEGNWDGAMAHAASSRADSSMNDQRDSPWAVLVTGVNGIRKTTSVYQPWFADVLSEALVCPSSSDDGGSADHPFSPEGLPNGHNSFFRQLDHIISTVCNEDFSLMYALTGAQLGCIDGDGCGGDGVGGDAVGEKTNDDVPTTTALPSRDLMRTYANMKAGIFARYRTLSELLGAMVLVEARNAGINVMCETSGRDLAMFRYLDHFFPPGRGYNKLALHYTINDVSHAMESVDARMMDEMRNGTAALETGDVLEVIYANLGGPYGSEALRGVQADSDRVWDEVVMGGGGVGDDWYKASMRINAHVDKQWTIQAVRPDGSFGTEYAFCEPRTV